MSTFNVYTFFSHDVFCLYINKGTFIKSGQYCSVEVLCISLGVEEGRLVKRYGVGVLYFILTPRSLV